MADKNTREEKIEVETKEPVREVKPKMIKGKIVNKTPTGFVVEYIVGGVSYGARIQYDAHLHSGLGVNDDIQIPI